MAIKNTGKMVDLTRVRSGAVVTNLPVNAEATGDLGLIPELERSPGEGNGNLQ